MPKNDQRSREERIRDAIYDQTGEFTRSKIILEAGNPKWHESVRREINRMVDVGLLEITCGRPKRYQWVSDDA